MERFGKRPDGYRLPDDTRLGMVRLQVSDLDHSIDWYERVLGFRVASRSAGVARLAPHGDSTPLVELHERRGAIPVPRRGRLGLYHFAILLPDRAALGRLVAHLAAIGARAGSSDHLVSEALYLHDPDGLGIEVYSDRPRSTWRQINGELTMDTHALDLEAVVREARGEAWTGLPAGTVIGHMHLRVGDLNEAAAFYHRALGLDAMGWSYPGALFLSAGGYHHHLGLNTWAGPEARPAGADEARLLEWEILVPGTADVGDAARSLVEAGSPVTPAGGGFTVADPWGTTLRLGVAPSR